MKTFTRSFLSLFLFLFALNVFAQQPAYDLALSHNRLIREKTGDGVYKQIGNFKVQGTSYLFGEKNKGNLFSNEAKALNIYLSYNTYNQELEFYSSSNPDKPLIKEPAEVDSFVIHPNIELGIISPLKFVSGKHIGSKDNAFYQEVYSGSKFSIYKKYRSELGFVSTNYIQPDLREFELILEYHYTDSELKMRKIKPNSVNVIKEFKEVKNLTEVAEADLFSTNADAAFYKVFEYLNR